jgi:hypothetical protein
MAFYVNIQKIQELNHQEALYKVEAYGDTFLIKINIQNQTIDIIHEPTKRSFLLDLNDPEKKIDIPWIPMKVVYAIFVKGKEAIQSKAFPENISFCS